MISAKSTPQILPQTLHKSIPIPPSQQIGLMPSNNMNTITPPISTESSLSSSSVGSHSPSELSLSYRSEDNQGHLFRSEDTSHSIFRSDLHDNNALSLDTDKSRMIFTTPTNPEGIVPVYHRTCSTPNIHYPFTSDGGSFRRFQPSHIYGEQPVENSVSSSHPSSSAISSSVSTTTSNMIPSSSGYSPLAFTQEQQAQYLYALYHQQLQSQLKEDQSQRLVMYGGSGFPQDSLMYYNARQSASFIASDTTTGSPSTKASTISSSSSSSPIVRDESNALFGSTANLNPQSMIRVNSVDSSSSSSAISTPPNSGSMSYTSSPASGGKDLMEGSHVAPPRFTGVGLPMHQQTPLAYYHPSMGAHILPSQVQHMGAAYGGSQSANSASSFYPHASRLMANNQMMLLHTGHPGHQFPHLTMVGNHQGNVSPSTSAMVHQQMMGGSTGGSSALKICSNCGCTSTPSWRRCPTGKQLLCNACGLYQKLHNKPRPFCVLDDGSVKVQRNAFLETTRCGHCNTTETPLWRRGSNGQSLCNACGLYFKQHRQYRPSLPNTGWLASGGYDADVMMNASTSMSPSPYGSMSISSAQGSIPGQNPLLSVSSTTGSDAGSPVASPLLQQRNNSFLGAQQHHSWIPPSTSPNSNDDLCSTTDMDHHAPHGDFHRQHDHPLIYTKTSNSDRHALNGLGGNSQPRLIPSPGVISMLEPSNDSSLNMSNSMSPEDEAAVSALAEQMLDAQELFTREETRHM